MRSRVLLVAVLFSLCDPVGAQQLALSARGPRFLLASSGRNAVEIDPATAPVFQRRVSLDLDDATIGDALAEIERQAGVRLVYSRDVLDPGVPARIKAEGITVAAALTEILLDAGVDVVLSDSNRLTLGPRKLPPPVQEGTIVGRVADVRSGEGLDEASVRVEGTQHGASTGVDGRYRIPNVVAGRYRVSVRRIGYVSRTESVTVVAGEEVTADFVLEAAPTRLDEVVTTTPGGMATAVRALPTPITVITAEDIEHQRPVTLGSVFRQAVPTGVSPVSPSQPVTVRFTARGASSLSGPGAMKVFVDGIETSSQNLTGIDPSIVERIEVIRGPQAATVFGADAVDGVVQITTKRGDVLLPRTQITTEALGGVLQTPYTEPGGAFRQQYAGSVRGGTSEASYHLGGDFSRLANWIPNDEISRQTSRNIQGGLQYRKGIIGLHVQARYARHDLPFVQNPDILRIGFLPFTRPRFTPGIFTNETYGGSLTLAPTGWVRSQLTLGIDRNHQDERQALRRLTTPDDTLLSIFDTQGRKASLVLNNAVSGTLGGKVAGSLTAGLDHYRVDVSSFSTSSALRTEGTIETEPPGAFFEGRATITNTGFFTQAEANWSQTVFLTAGLRGDDNSTFGADLSTPISPRVGVSMVREISSITVKVRAAYGRAIRAPSPGQAFGVPGSAVTQLANPLLRPERQGGWDGGIDLVIGARGSFSVTGFTQEARDLIAVVQVPGTAPLTLQFQNVGSVRNKGVEVEGTFRVGPVEVRGQYGYVRSRVEDVGPDALPGAEVQVGDRPLGVPTHTAGASLGFTLWSSTTLTAGVAYVGSRRDTDFLALLRCFATGPCEATPRGYVRESPGFAKVNATITQALTRQLEAILAIDNLTNHFAMEDGTLGPVKGRLTMLGLRARL